MPSGRDDKYDFFLSRRGSVATIAQEVSRTGCGTRTFEIDQNFEPGARNRRPTAVGGSEDAGSSMSDEFDSLGCGLINAQP